ncbi:MAG TPA: hypothetical protein VLE96_04785 [Chlamydiales bacterium]|nr:hypothetical protein [Chlamydiales bacterium]
MLYFTFLLSAIALFLQTTLFPQFVILAFAPWIALTILTRPLPKCLPYVMIIGAIVDLLSEDPMGVHALNYTLIALVLYRYRLYFSFDQPLHLSLFTFLVSFGSTTLQLFLLFLFDRRIPFTGEWVFGDLVLMPIADALIAIVWFAYPLKLFSKGCVYWISIKKRFFPTTL